MTRRFENFIEQVRKDIPVCPACGEGTHSCFVCPECAAVHCWYCEEDLIEVPKSILEQTSRKRAQHQEPDLPPALKEMLSDIAEAVAERIMGASPYEFPDMMAMSNAPPQIVKWVTDTIRALGGVCPSCGVSLENTGICADYHLHCEKCEDVIAEVPQELRPIQDAAKNRYLH